MGTDHGLANVCTDQGYAWVQIRDNSLRRVQISDIVGTDQEVGTDQV